PTRRIRGRRGAAHPDQGLRADEHPGRPGRAGHFQGRLLPLLRFEGRAAGGCRGAHSRGRDRGARAGRGRSRSLRSPGAGGGLRRPRAVEGRAEGAAAGAHAGLALGRERDHAREVSAAHHDPPHAHPGQDRAAGQRRGCVPHRLGRARGGRLHVARTWRQRDGQPALRRLPGRRHLNRERGAHPGCLRRGVRAHPRARTRLLAGRVQRDPARVVRVTRGASMTAIIETERLTKSYGVHRGIIEVNLAVQQREVFGFLGPNGAGKTTTIRLLLDLIRPTRGRARVFGLDTTRDAVAIHRRVGYLPGEFALYDRLTGGQTLEYFANLRGGVDRAYQRSLIERFDLDPSRRFREYSKGNKQKVGLIVTLQHRPELLILDEPTAGLDPLV